MLTCICPGMSSANHTLNSLRYAERLKEKNQPSSNKLSKQDQERVQEELKMFLEKFGVDQEEQAMNNVFYQDDRLDQMMDDDEQLLMENDDVLMQNELEDDEAMIQPPPKQKKTTTTRVTANRKQSQPHNNYNGNVSNNVKTNNAFKN